MKLNKTHRRIIADRPADCILEVARDSDDTFVDQFADDDDAMDFIESVQEKLAAFSELNFSSLTESERWILRDIVGGSTCAACLVIEGTRGGTQAIVIADGHEGEYRSIVRAGRQLADECGCVFSET